VVALDFDSECIRRFQLCAGALGSKVTRPQVHSIYALDPSVMGTFDLVMFFGLLYHLKHPLLGTKKVAAMTSGTL
jgi:tRNA (mo5U34)-methyltransferase